MKMLAENREFAARLPGLMEHFERESDPWEVFERACPAEEVERRWLELIERTAKSKSRED